MARKDGFVYVGVHIPKEVHDMLVQKANKEDKSISAILRTILNSYIESQKGK